MKAKFTKGEWVVDSNGDVIIKGSGGGVNFPAHDGTIASLNDGEYIENNNEHDAHLIASAPEMYELLDRISKGEKVWSADEVISLLQKADGEIT